MKKINKLTLENFKFFKGKQEFDFKGKNILIYGENGSGKSSIYWALYTFFKSSLKTNEDIKKYFDTSNKENLNNRFMQDNEKSSIKIEFDNTQAMSISNDSFETNNDDDTQIQEAVKASDFINFKLLSRLYDFRIKQDIDLFIMFEKEVLDYIFQDERNLSHLWEELKKGLSPKPKMTDKKYKDFQNKLKNFNEYFEKMLPIISTKANKFLEEDFKEIIEIKLEYTKATYNAFIPDSTTTRDGKTKAPIIKLTVKMLNQDIENKIISKPHIFLNEAKLTAISLSLRFAILQNRLSTGLKILVLDDLLISLDMEYRIEVIHILDKYFSDFQQIIMTHDKGFYQLLKRKVTTKDWNVYELYNQDDRQYVKEAKTSFDKAKILFEDKDYEATAHFLRKETEEILKHYLDPNLKYINNEFMNLEALIKKVKQEIESDYVKNFDKFFKNKGMNVETAKKIKNFENDKAIDEEIREQLFKARGDLFTLFIKYAEYKNSEVKIFDELRNIKNRVLNPSSHYSEAPIFTREIEDAIDLIDRLKNFLKGKSSINTPKQTKKCIEKTEANSSKIPSNLNSLMINFRDDILDKMIDIKSSPDLDLFLSDIMLNNMTSLDIEQFDKIVNKLMLYNRSEYFNSGSEEIIKKLFAVKEEWGLEYKKIWCKFINGVNVSDDMKEWFENRECFQVHYDNEFDQDSCSFLYKKTEEEDGDIPF